VERGSAPEVRARAPCLDSPGGVVLWSYHPTKIALERRWTDRVGATLSRW